jgi:hypothetical protein
MPMCVPVCVYMFDMRKFDEKDAAGYVCVCACIHACIQTYIHIYIHTYIHTYTYTHAYIHTCVHIRDTPPEGSATRSLKECLDFGQRLLLRGVAKARIGKIDEVRASVNVFMCKNM